MNVYWSHGWHSFLSFYCTTMTFKALNGTVSYIDIIKYYNSTAVQAVFCDVEILCISKSHTLDLECHTFIILLFYFCGSKHLCQKLFSIFK